MKTKLVIPLLCLVACGRASDDTIRDLALTPLPPASNVTASAASFHAAFYVGTDLEGTPLVEHDTPTIDYVWADTSPGCGVPVDYFSARWTGDIELASGTYRFDTYSDDGVRVSVDGQLVIDFWTDHGATAMANTVTVADGLHQVVVEYYERTGDAVVRVDWTLEDGTPPPPPPSTDDPDLAAAQAFVADLALGVNVERGWAWEVGSDYYRYLRDDLGATHVRLFYPWRPNITMGGGGPGNSAPDGDRFARILDAAQQAIDAGLKVFLDCSDVIDDDEADGIRDHVRHCAQWIAERGFDPERIAVGPINEHAGSDNTTWNPIRSELHTIMRDALPGFVLTTGAAGWKGRPDLLRDDFELFEDLRIIYEWHHYDSASADDWAARGAELARWREARGDRPTVCGECGPGYWDEIVDGTRLANAPWVWPQRFAEQLPSLAFERPMLWAVTYGGDYRLNASGSDPTLTPQLAESFRANAQAIRAATR